MLKKKRTVKVIILCCALILLATGCWGARETDELGYILAMGIDKGKESDLHITFQVASLKGGSAGEGGGEKGSELFTVEAASIFGALQLANAFVSRDLTLMHNRAVIVSADVARDGLSEYINAFVRSREIRRNTFLFITPGQAADVMKNNKPILESNPSRQLELLTGAKKFAGFLVATDIHEMNTALKSPGQEAVAALIGINKGKEAEEKNQGFEEKIRQEVSYLPGEIPRQGGNKIDVIGTAVFRGDKLAGYLDGTETRYYQMVRGSFDRAIVTFPDPEEPEKYALELRIKKGRSPGINVSFIDEVPQVEVSIILEAEIVSLDSGIDYETGEKELALERYLEKYITAEISKVIKKTQEEYKSDIFGFGDYTRKYFLTWQDWQDYGWLERYPEAQISINTSLAIRRTGLMSNTTELPPIKKKGD